MLSMRSHTHCQIQIMSSLIELTSFYIKSIMDDRQIFRFLFPLGNKIKSRKSLPTAIHSINASQNVDFRGKTLIYFGHKRDDFASFICLISDLPKTLPSPTASIEAAMKAMSTMTTQQHHHDSRGFSMQTTQYEKEGASDKGEEDTKSSSGLPQTSSINCLLGQSTNNS